MRTKRHHSPWAYEASVAACPRCYSENVHHIFDRWGRMKGVQMFQCTSCGKKYYARGLDDYTPTFSRRFSRRR
ncbi:MAG: hypothetical protein ACFFER_19590 [Candidatus Thorarchaeota archaeon]